MSSSNDQGNRRSAIYRGMLDIISHFIPDDIFGGRYEPSENIMNDVLALSREANTNESENYRIAQLLFSMGSGYPLWYAGNSPKRLLDDFDPERDTNCVGLLPEGKTPADGMVKRLGYAHRVYARTKRNNYVSATIDVDIDVPLFCPVDEYRENHAQDDLSWFISQSVIGEAGDNWEDSVKIALDDLIESGQIKNTPYWALKKAFEFFAQDFSMGLLPIVEVDPISLKAHFTLYTGYMPMSVHQEMTRIVSETFFKGMYDKALTEGHRALALTRVGSMSKSDGMNGKFLYRRFLWSFGAHSRVATVLLFTRTGFEAYEAPEQKLSKLRSLAMENGVQVKRGREFQYKVVRAESRPCDMVTTVLDAYMFSVYAVTRSTPKLYSILKDLGDNLFRAVKFGLEYTDGLNPSWIYSHEAIASFPSIRKAYDAIMLGEKHGWDLDLAEEDDRRLTRRPWYQLTSRHLIDYNEKNEPRRRRVPRYIEIDDDDDDDISSRRRRRSSRRRSGESEGSSSEETTSDSIDLDDDDEDDERPRRRVPRRRRSAVKDDASEETPTKSTDIDDDDEERPTATPANDNSSDHSEKPHVKLGMSDSEYRELVDEVYNRIIAEEKQKNDAADNSKQDEQNAPVYENPLKKLCRQFEAEKAAEEARKADPHYQKLEAERRAIQEQRDREKQEYKRRLARIISINDQEEKYGKLAWKRTLKEKARTNKKGHLIGVEALYLMMSKGQNCRFGGLFGDPARMAGLMTFVYTLSSDKGGVTFDDNPHVLKSELNNKQWSAAVESVASTISNMGYQIYSRSATKLARIVVDTALYGMGQAVHELAMDITTNSNLSREWMTHFERGLRDMEHSIVSDQFANPYSVRSRHRKIHTHENKSLDVITNVYMKGKRGALTPMEFVELTGAVLNFDIENLRELPVKAAMKASQMALVEQPEIHVRKRDLRENAAYIAKVAENAEKGFRAARSPEEHVQNAATLRGRRMDVVRRSPFVLEGEPITPAQAHEIVDAMKGDAYDPATESFTAIMSLTKDMLGSDNQYDTIWDIREDISRSDDRFISGDIAYLKALLAVHVESLSRSTVKRRSSGSSRVIDLTAMYRRDWNDPKAMTTPWSGKLLAKQFDRVTRDMTVQSHDDVIEQDKEKADLAFSKKQTQEREQRKFNGGVPNFLVPSDINETPHSSTKVSRGSKSSKEEFLADYGSVRKAGTDAYSAASQIFEPKYTFMHRGSTSKMTATEFMKYISLSDVLNGKVYMTTDFTRDYGHGAASGKIDQFPCPTSTFLKAEKDEDGNVTIKSIADAHYYSVNTFTAATLLLSVMQNKRRLSFDRAIKGLHSLDKILSTREYDGSTSMPLSSRYFAMQSGINHNDANRLIQDLAAIGLIDRAGGKLQGTLIGPAKTKQERAVQELCERVAPGIIGQERASSQDFVESGQFLSTYTSFHKDGFMAEADGEFYRFSAEEIIKGFHDLEGVTDQNNPFMMVIESALRRLDAMVDKEKALESDELRKSNLFDIRMDYVLTKVEQLTTDQYQNAAAVIRAAIVRNLGYVAPSQLDGLTDVDAAFRSTSKLYEGIDSEIMRTYGYWIQAVIESNAALRIPGSQIRREFSRIVRFISGRGGMAEELLSRVSDFTSNILAMEIAYRSWNTYAADLAAAAREFRRSYRALVNAVSRGVHESFEGSVDLAALSGPPLVGIS